MDSDKELQDLLDQRQKLNDKINDHVKEKYQKYKGMSEEVKDDNPYRLAFFYLFCYVSPHK